MAYSTNQKILFIDSEKLNNAYLSLSLEMDGFSLDYMRFQDFVKSPPERLKSKFTLIDFQCDKTEVVIEGLKVVAQARGASDHKYALFNVSSNLMNHKVMDELTRQGLVGIFYDGDSLGNVCLGVQMIMEGESWIP